MVGDPIQTSLNRRLEVGATSSTGWGAAGILSVSIVGVLIGEELEGLVVDGRDVADVLSVDGVGTVVAGTDGRVLARAESLERCDGSGPRTTNAPLSTGSIASGLISSLFPCLDLSEDHGPGEVASALLAAALADHVDGTTRDGCRCGAGEELRAVRAVESTVAGGGHVVLVEGLDERGRVSGPASDGLSVAASAGGAAVVAFAAGVVGQLPCEESRVVGDLGDDALQPVLVLALDGLVGVEEVVGTAGMGLLDVGVDTAERVGEGAEWELGGGVGWEIGCPVGCRQRLGFRGEVTSMSDEVV